jgi:hypothetical protein
MDGSFSAIARVDEHRGVIDRVEVLAPDKILGAFNVFRGMSNK